jgi:hypothetical protein
MKLAEKKICVAVLIAGWLGLILATLPAGAVDNGNPNLAENCAATPGGLFQLSLHQSDLPSRGWDLDLGRQVRQRPGKHRG